MSNKPQINCCVDHGNMPCPGYNGDHGGSVSLKGLSKTVKKEEKDTQPTHKCGSDIGACLKCHIPVAARISPPHEPWEASLRKDWTDINNEMLWTTATEDEQVADWMVDKFRSLLSQTQQATRETMGKELIADLSKLTINGPADPYYGIECAIDRIRSISGITKDA